MDLLSVTGVCVYMSVCMSVCLYQSTSNHLENSAPDPGAVSLSFLLDGFGDESMVERFGLRA